MKDEDKEALDIVVSNMFENSHLGNFRDRNVIETSIKALSETPHLLENWSLEQYQKFFDDLLEDRKFLFWVFKKLEESTVNTEEGFKLDVSWSGEPSLYRIFRFMRSNEPKKPKGIAEYLRGEAEIK